MQLGDTPLEQITFVGKNIFVNGLLYVYHDSMDELKRVLRKHGAILQDKLNEDTDIIVYACYCYDDGMDGYESRPTISTKLEKKMLAEPYFYDILYRLGERGSKGRKFPKQWPENDEINFIRNTDKRKRIAQQENWYAYPSFEMKNVFLHGKFRKFRKTFVKLLEKYGGCVQDDFKKNTDIVVCGTNFSLDFLDHIEELRKKRRLIIMDEESFFEQFEMIDKLKKDCPRYYDRKTEDTDRRKIIRNECNFASELERQGKIPEAIEIYEKCMMMKVPYGDMWYRLIDIYHKMGDYLNELWVHDHFFANYAPHVRPGAGDFKYQEQKREKCLALIEESKR